jgi:hypothetical protein
MLCEIMNTVDIMHLDRISLMRSVAVLKLAKLRIASGEEMRFRFWCWVLSNGLISEH